MKTLPLSTIAARFVRPYVGLIGEQAGALGLDRIDFDDPEARVDYAVAIEAIELGRRVVGRDDLGLLGALNHAGSLRILEYMSRVSRTPLEALSRSARFQNLIHDACLFEVIPGVDRVEARLGSQAGTPFPPTIADFFLASLVLGLYRLGVPSDGAAVYLRHAAPADRSTYEQVFRCPLHFGADGYRASFPRAGLTQPLPDADAALCAALERHAEAMQARLPRTDGFCDQVKAVLARRLGHADIEARHIAEALGTSERTLRRRLQAEGATFQALTDEVRMSLAGEYLGHADLAVDEVAFLLGFSEASALRRAYRRWHGRPLPKRRASALS